MRREIFESLRPAQDIHPKAVKAGRVEDKEPEKVEESGAHETEVNLRNNNSTTKSLILAQDER